MSVLNVSSIAFAELNSSFRNLNFTLTLDAASTVPQTYYWYFGDGTATAAIDYAQNSGTVTFNTGETSRTVSLAVYGDTAIEPNETVQLVVYSGNGNSPLAGGAAALLATATIQNDDGGSPSGGSTAAATALFGPTAIAGVLPTLSVRDVTVTEVNSSFEYARFLVTLDRPATAPVTFHWATMDGSASTARGDYAAASGTITIAAGQQSTHINVAYYGDVAIEANETFGVVLTEITNGVFAGGAPALRATGTILDNDGGAVSGTGGIGDFAQVIAGPSSASSTVPTVNVFGATVGEGASSFDYARFVVVLDRPATAPVTFSYATQDGSGTAGFDYAAASGTVTIAAGEQSAYINIAVYGDSVIERNETFSLVLTDLHGGVFAGGAAALQAQGHISEDDAGVPNITGGIGGEALQIAAPIADGLSTPVLRVVGTSINEGNSSFEYTTVHLLLSQAAATNITLNYSLADGSAIGNTDFAGSTGTVTIAAGETSTALRIAVYGDTAIEGDEFFNVTFSNIQGAHFENGTTTATAAITIRDNDGTGSAGSTEAGPQFGEAALNSAMFDNSVTIRSAASSVDVAGTPGATDIVYTGAAAFIGVGSGDDNRMIGGAANDYFYTYDGADTADGAAGIDVFILGNGEDTAHGGDGQDYFFGNDGNDYLYGDGGVDVLNGEGGDDLLTGGDGGDYFYGGAGNDTAIGEAGNDIFVMEAGNDTAWGGEGQDYFYMGDGNDVMNGAAGVDVMLGEGGNDTFNGGLGVDYMFLGPGGAGDNDTVIVDRTLSGVTVINNFEAGGTNDVVRLVGVNFNSFAQVQAAISDFSASGGFCVLTLDADTNIWFIGVTPGQLTSADFGFA